MIRIDMQNALKEKEDIDFLSKTINKMNLMLFDIVLTNFDKDVQYVFLE